jgi:NDP-sugar pyrophosphorylase family protein
LYGDNLYHFDIGPLVAFHREKRAVATIATFEAANPSACGLVITDANGRVTRFQEKPPPHEVFTNTANAGVYVLEPAIFDYLPPDDGRPLDWGRDVFPLLLERGIVYSCPLNGYLQDTGTPDTYRQANWDTLGGATGETGGNNLLVGHNTRIAPSATLYGRNIVGNDVEVANGVFLADTIVWAGCRIGAGARVNGAVLGHNVTVGDGAVIERGALVADGARIAPGAHCAEDARVAPGQIVTAAA